MTRVSEPERLHPIIQAIGGTPAARELESRLPRGGERLTVGGVVGSAGSCLGATLWAAHPSRVFVLVAEDAGAAGRVQADVEALLGEGVAYLYPPSEARLHPDGEPDPRIDALKVEAVEALLGARSRLFVTTPLALQERIDVPDRLGLLHLELHQGEEVGLSLLVEQLESMGYERVPLVQQIGQFAVRGGLVDIFSLGLADPARIEFWGDEITSIRSFEVSDQRSVGEMDSIRLLPTSLAAEANTGSNEAKSVLEVLPTDTVLVDLHSVAWEDEFQRRWTYLRRAHGDDDQTSDSSGLDRLLLAPERAAAALRSLPLLRTAPDQGFEVSLETHAPPSIERSMPRLRAYLREQAAGGARTLILCDNDGQAERLEEILGEDGTRIPGLTLGIGAVDKGFSVEASPTLNVLTDHEIFRRSRRVSSGRRFQGSMALESVAQLTPGDYVVHLEHGIGQFRGLEQIRVGSEDVEVLVIAYADSELLRVPVYRVDLIERWVGATEDSEPPTVHRVGGKQWKTLRKKTEAAIETMTRELLELYAEREVAEGFAFSADTKWQREMEASFLYVDTPDQRKATNDVKRDMESARPMDRLVCGDVGFGKTEVAMRAAFKAVQDGKQVAFLAPTTILVEQHRRTLEARLADFPVRIGAVSRFHQSEVAETLEALERGEIDIVVGTHRLLSSDVRFRSLGLLIVDEEQRFGVKHKEALKKMRATVDVLTLTATPIPRTLQLGLAGVRNISLIRTPPRDRLSISTHALVWNDGHVAEIIARELDRGGQAFVLHNRVETIEVAGQRIRRLVPEAVVEVAHGQMSGSKLERVMESFLEGDIDVLVCSSIIENGLDVPNANTLIVDRADRFGLSQLYQIRGRVGRSNRRAYCYLVLPENVTEEARHRVRVLERHTELGSGYQVALHDLEMRGAGNLLGADQSGFAHAVGMDTYLRLLEEAVRRMRRSPSSEPEYPETDVSLSGSAYIPDTYVSDAAQKLHLYRRLTKIENRAELDGLREEINDRFGPPPEEVERLLDARALRLLGTQLGVARIYVKGTAGRVSFRDEANPRMTTLEGPLRDRQIEVGVARMSPLALSLHQRGPEPLASTLVRGFAAMVDALGRQG